jgi:dGTPase
MQATERLVAFSANLRRLLDPFRAFLFSRVYWHPAVSGSNQEAVEMMRRLFMHYIRNPESLGRKAQARLPKEGLWRTVCDYIAGMTDRYAIEEYIKFGLSTQP